MKKVHRTAREVRREDGLILRNKAGYNLIKPMTVPEYHMLVRRNHFRERLDGTLLGWAVLSGAAAYTLSSAVMVPCRKGSKLNRTLLVTAATAIASAAGAGAAWVTDRVNANELTSKKYIEYTHEFIKVESEVTQDISDDVRVTRSVMLYRRDLLDGIKRRGEDLGYKDCGAPCSFELSRKSHSQLLATFCAEFGKIHAEFVEDIRNSTIYSFAGNEIIIKVMTNEAMERIKAASERIDEVFAVFGLCPIFFSGEDATSKLIFE